MKTVFFIENNIKVSASYKVTCNGYKYIFVLFLKNFRVKDMAVAIHIETFLLSAYSLSCSSLELIHHREN